MTRSRLALVLLPLTFIACRQARPPLDEAYTTAKNACEAASTAEEKARIYHDFLALYPESEHTMEALATAVYYLTEELDRAREADALVVEVLHRVEDPALRRDVLVERLGPLAFLGDARTFTAAVAELQGIQPLTFPDNAEVIDAALEVGAWELALERTAAGLSQATPEQYRDDYPNRTFTDEEAVDAADRRREAMLTARGWALANLERMEEATAAFAEVDATETKGYTGTSSHRLGTYRGRSLLLAGKPHEALAALAPEAIFGDDEDALAALYEAYRAIHGTVEGFDAYLWGMRTALARSVADFVLPDYQGVEHSFSGLRKGKVALLAFWFPT